MPFSPVGSAPVGQLTSLGIGKEASFGVPVAPTIFHETETFSPSTKNVPIMRPGSARRAGTSFPSTGPIDISMSFRPGAVPDTVPQLFAYAMGSESIVINPVAANVAQPLPINTSLTVASAIGATSVTVAATTNMVSGANVLIDAGTSYQETAIINTIAGMVVTFTAALKAPHSIGARVSFFTAYDHTMTFGQLLALPSFTTEYNRLTDAVDYFGCTVDSMKIALDVGKGLSADFGISAASLILNGSPATPSFSSKDLYTMEAPTTYTTINGVAIGSVTGSAAPNITGNLFGQVAVRKWDISLSNALEKNYRGAGGARQVLGFPLGQRKVTGSMTLGFENNSIFKAFLGSVVSGPATSGPGTAVNGIPIQFAVSCEDSVNPAVPFTVRFVLPNVWLDMSDVPNKTSGPLEVPVTFTAGESVRGAGDDLSIVATTASSVAY